MVKLDLTKASRKLSGNEVEKGPGDRILDFIRRYLFYGTMMCHELGSTNVT